MCNCWVWFAVSVATLCLGGVFFVILGYKAAERRGK